MKLFKELVSTEFKTMSEQEAKETQIIALDEVRKIEVEIATERATK